MTLEDIPEGTQLHKWLRDDTIKVKLMKMSKGYQWEISVEEPTIAGAIKKIEVIDQELRELYEKEEGTS